MRNLHMVLLVVLILTAIMLVRLLWVQQVTSLRLLVLVLLLLVLVAIIVLVRNRKEQFTVEVVTKEDISRWIQSINPDLTTECLDCIFDNVIKLWKKDDLDRVLKLSLMEQKAVLNTLLLIDCRKQCSIQVIELERKVIELWVQNVQPDLADECQQCVIDYIMRNWTNVDFIRVQLKKRDEQQQIIQALYVLNCPVCDQTPKLEEKDVNAWLSKVLTGERKECRQCIVGIIMGIWDAEKFQKIISMDMKSQQQIVQSLIALNCERDCILVPSGLIRDEVKMWLINTLPKLDRCSECVIDAIQKLWTPELLKNVQSKPKDEQLKIIQGLVAFHCTDVCGEPNTPMPITPKDILEWLQNVIDPRQIMCIRCVVRTIMATWDPRDFNELRKRPVDDQIKIAKMIAVLNCPQRCQMMK